MTDPAVGIVGVFDIVKGLELSPLFPGQCVTKVRNRVPLRIVGDGLAVERRQSVFPYLVPVGVRLAILAEDVPVVVIGHDIDGFAVCRLRQKLAESIIGIFSGTANRVDNLCDSLFRVVLIRDGASAGQYNLAHQVGCRRRFQFASCLVLLGNLTRMVVENAYALFKRHTLSLLFYHT